MGDRTKAPAATGAFVVCSGGGDGIRTRGRLRSACRFGDGCNRPLCHATTQPTSAGWVLRQQPSTKHAYHVRQNIGVQPFPVSGPRV